MAEAHVLLVEDNPGDVRLVREAFADGPVESDLHVVWDGDAALSFLHQTGEYVDAPRPDLVLLDLNLPKTSGEELLTAVAENSTLAQIPVVVLTSSDAPSDVATAYDRQANAYVRKPIDPEAFVSQIWKIQTFWLSAV